MQEVKFQLSELLGIGMTFVVLGIGVAYGLEVTSDVQKDLGKEGCAARTDTSTLWNESARQCYNTTGEHVPVGTAEFNATGNAIAGVSKIPNKLPTIATVVVAAVILGILVTYLWARFR